MPRSMRSTIAAYTAILRSQRCLSLRVFPGAARLRRASDMPQRSSTRPSSHRRCVAPPAQFVPADQGSGPGSGRCPRPGRAVESAAPCMPGRAGMAARRARNRSEEGDRPVGERIGYVEVGIVGRERAGEAPVVAPQPVVAGRLVHRFRLARPAHAGIEVVAAAGQQPPVAVEAAVDEATRRGPRRCATCRTSGCGSRRRAAARRR